MGLNRSEAPHGLDEGLGYDERNGTRALEGAHRMFCLVCEVAMLITCRDLEVQAREGGCKHDRTRPVPPTAVRLEAYGVYRLSDFCVAGLCVRQALLCPVG